MAHSESASATREARAPAGLASEPLHSLVQGEEMTADDGTVGLARTLRPKRAAAIRATCAASILASCGT